MENKALKSYIHVDPNSHFSIYNIPFGVFVPKADHKKQPRCGSRIGDYVVDLGYIESHGWFNGPLFTVLHKNQTVVFGKQTLNEFMALGKPYWTEARTTIQQILSFDSLQKEDMEFRNFGIYDIKDVIMNLPADIKDYTDFYSSKNHAFNCGVILRGVDNALQANWTHIPVGYHGRSSTVVLDESVIRPRGQIKPPDRETPIFSECKRLDFELEIGAFLGGKLNNIGHPIKCSEAEQYIFGLVLLNDWSARDIQAWEYVPLGPFLGKNFCTTISPWIVTMDALEEFRLPLPKQDPEPLPYLKDPNLSAFDLKLEVKLKTEKSQEPEAIVKSNFKYMYWSIAQQLAHHSVTGCKMNPGDLLGSGTISGKSREEFGSMLEISQFPVDGVKSNLKLKSGEERAFINDYDTVIFSGFSERKDGFKVGFGESACTVKPCLSLDNYYTQQ